MIGKSSIQIKQDGEGAGFNNKKFANHPKASIPWAVPRFHCLKH